MNKLGISQVTFELYTQGKQIVHVIVGTAYNKLTG